MVTKAAFFWNNQPAEGGGNFTLQAGITPSTAVLRLPMSANVAQIGNLTLTDGTTTTTFSRCRVVRVNIAEGGGDGRWKEITIEDRRWMWSEGFFAVFGEFNRIDPPRGAQRNQTSAYQLAIRLLAAMQEVGYSIFGMPADQFPTVSWDAATPSSELELLCKQYGCGVTLQPNDRVSIFKFGTGATFNGSDPRLMDVQYTYQPQIVPGQLVLDGGAMHVHHDLPLRAVGPKGKYGSEFVPINDLTYKPGGVANGTWAFQDDRMMGVDIAYRALAVDNVFKVYEICQGFSGAPDQSKAKKIEFPIPPSIKLSGSGQTQQVSDLKEFLTVDNESIHRLLPLNEKRYNFPAFASDEDVRVYGFWWIGGKLNRNTRYDISEVNDIYADAASQLPSMADSSAMPLDDPILGNSELLIDSGSRKEIDLKNGRVHFNKPIFFQETLLGVVSRKEAWLRLRCSFPIRDPQTMALLTSQYWLNPASPIEVNITKVVKNSDIFLEYTTTGKSNLTEFVSASFNALANDISQISHSEGVSAPYQTWVFNIPIDGIIKAIVWDQAENGAATTHIDYNIERPSFYETLNERRTRRLFAYNALLLEEEKRRKNRGVTQVRLGAARP